MCFVVNLILSFKEVFLRYTLVNFVDGIEYFVVYLTRSYTETTQSCPEVFSQIHFVVLCVYLDYFVVNLTRRISIVFRYDFYAPYPASRCISDLNRFPHKFLFSLDYFASASHIFYKSRMMPLLSGAWGCIVML